MGGKNVVCKEQEGFLGRSHSKEAQKADYSEERILHREGSCGSLFVHLPLELRLEKATTSKKLNRNDRGGGEEERFSRSESMSRGEKQIRV